MDQGTGDLESRGDRSRVRETRISMSSTREGASIDDVYIDPNDSSASSSGSYDAEEVAPEDIERTRAHMSSTIEEIQDRLNVANVEDTAKEVTSDVKEAVNEAVDHAMEQLKATLPTVTDQARDLAQQTIDHAILEAKSAIRELGAQARDVARDATIGKVERMAQSTSDKVGQLAQTTSDKAEQVAQTTTVSTKKAGSSLMTTIKQNPIPAALTGLGLGWMAMSGMGGGAKSQSSGGSSSNEKTVQERTSDTGISFSTPTYTGQTSGTTNGDSGDSGMGATDKAKQTASAVTDQARDAASTVTGQAKETASTVTGQAKETASTVTEQVSQISTRLRQTLKDKPLALGMVAVAVGSAAGMAVPVSQRETQVFGESRDKLMEKAQTGAQDLVEKVQKVATEAGTAVEKEAKYQGLTPEE